MAFEIEARLGQRERRLLRRERAAHVIGQTLGQDRRRRFERHGPLDHVFELPDIPGPVVQLSSATESLEMPTSGLAICARVLREEVLGEQRNVLASIAQRRQLHRV